MTPAELRALVAQGPAVVMVAKDDMLKLLDEREKLRLVLRAASIQFDYYGDQHEAKGTPEAAEKAKVNREFAAFCRAALEPSP
jgi:hypothetical protein